MFVYILDSYFYCSSLYFAFHPTPKGVGFQAIGVVIWKVWINGTYQKPSPE
jgi:hypothetical protein